ncbi:hypothetical protein DFQ14_101249 [Halopolyspora algeriensis]|uniref:Transmembrane protein n=1 Tax=Halopolyspora algeriensis TaxID=1500506 RepID=A0A368VZP8_9ACTN|nr:hypothetical protein [Halopolyspora algeriensis]RCW46909.1 hypothetical protein DFQ14_101249 [Halopolyspora algeriensis]TQM48000.1 hypothetical protein FHU43_2952 [Halopolyspora algeriensis]
MSRDSGSEHPSQRTVAELLAQHGGGSQRSARRRRRRAEDPTDTAPQAIIERVNSDSGRMRPVPPQEETPQAEGPHFTRGSGNGVGTAPSPQPGAAAEPASADVETTAQQPAVSERPEPPPVSPSPVPADTSAIPAVSPPAPTGAAGHDGSEIAAPVRPKDESATEQFPSVHGTVQQAPGGTDGVQGSNGARGHAGGANGTVLPGRQDTGELVESGGAYQDEYALFDGEVESGAADGHFFGDEGLDEDDPDGDFGGRYSRNISTELPAGMDAEDYLDEEFETEEGYSPRHSPLREWLTLITQVGAGLLGGGAVWVGFRWLWTAIPVAALVAALAVTGALVLIARRFLRTDDLQTILLAVLVGLVCTVSPAALLLVGY